MSARSRPAPTARAAAAAPARRAAIPPPVRAVLGSHGATLAPALQTQLADGLGIDLSGIPPHPRAAPSSVAASEHPEERFAELVSCGGSRVAPMPPRAAEALAHIRVHTGPLAAMAARAMQAQAFALDGHLVFGAGAWRPETAEGRALIAHEVVHAARPGPAGTLWRKALLDGSREADEATPTELAQLQSQINAPPEQDQEPPSPQQPAKPGMAAPPRPPSPTVALPAAAPPPTPAPGTEPKQQAEGEKKQVSNIATGDLALIDEELAEHERWGAAAATVGAAGTAERAGFVAEQVGGGLGKGAKEGVKGGIKSTVEIKIAEKLLEKAAIATAVRLGAKAGAFKAVPGVGAVVGGAMAAYDLAERDWGKTGDQIVGFGKGADIYEQLANSIESISTVLEVATQVANVIAGILGVIVVISWIAAVASGGALGPLATLLSTIAIKIGLVSMVIDAINSLVLKELVTTFRAMHAFASEADPRDVVAQGVAVEQAAGAGTGFVAGFAAGAALNKGLHMATEKPPPKVPEHPTPPAKGGQGPHVKAEPPAKTAPETAAPATGEKPPAAAAPAAAEPPAAPAPEAPAAAAPEKPMAAPAEAAAAPASGDKGPGGGGTEPPGGGGGGAAEPKKYGPVDERSFAELNDIVGEMDKGPFGDRLQAAEAQANQPPARAPAGEKYGASQQGGLRRALLREQPKPAGGEGQHWTKWEDAKAPPAGQRMPVKKINENRSWLQDSPNKPATLLLSDSEGRGHEVFRRSSATRSAAWAVCREEGRLTGEGP